MIKAAGSTDGKPLLILGLSQENLNRLPNNQPIRITDVEMVALGLPAMEIVLVGGETEETIVDTLHEIGWLG